MKKIIIISLVLIVAAGILFYFKFYNNCCKSGSCTKHSETEESMSIISLKGNFHGKNIFVQNPFANDSAFCVREVSVNDKIVSDIKATAFEIKFLSLGLKEGDNVDIKITHEKGCKPRVLNAYVLDANLGAKSDTLLSVITCPKCGYKKAEPMPTAVCQIKYTCESCKTVMTPKDGDCCVFCTHGDQDCPSMQEG